MHYSVKMRAARETRHISGAERIVAQDQIQDAVRSLARRALEHPNGEPDFVSVTVRKIAECVRATPALPVFEPESRNPKEARRLLERELDAIGLDSRSILDLFYSLQGMRGAVLLHERTLERMEPDPRRGVRATCMDYTGNAGSGKNHFKEALCLASKVAACPFITGELCMSDDPDYTTGYFASRRRGYVRIGALKQKGDPRGGRIFLFGGTVENVRECMHYLEKTPVLVVMD